MFTEARKLHLIEEVLKIDNEYTLSALEAVLQESTIKQENSKKSFTVFSGIWSKEEADEIEKVIAENCGQINPDDWK